MPLLGDYLGALLAEITNARLQADLESARLAQLYASHPLLQHMPVPRFRLPNVVLDLPVAVDSTSPPAGPGAALPAVRQRIEGIIDQEIKQRELHLTPAVRKGLSKGLDGVFGSLKKSGSLTASDALQASEAAAAAVDPTLGSSLRQQFALEFLKMQPLPSRVQALVATAQLKDIGPPAALTRIQLTISEEGVEWAQTNPSDSSSKTLIPE
jgi:hypothetical protein